MTTFRAFSVALLACLAIASTAFQPANSRVVGSARPFIGRWVSTRLHEKNSPKSEFEVGEDEYSGDIDWDSEWQKVVKEQGSGKEKRPSGNYKTDAERAAIRATNKVAEQVAKVKVQAPSFKAPEIRSLQGDWKFWIGILALISIGTSLLAASGQSATYTSDSFYI